MNYENFPEELFDLLNSKAVSELTASERELILEYMTIDEFAAYQAIVADLKAENRVLEIETPPFEAPKPTWYASIVHYPIPAYQVAAGFLLMICLFGFWPQKGSLHPSTEQETTVQAPEKGNPIDEETYPENLVFNF